MGLLDGKVALVNGAAGGIGNAIATGLAREGAHVVLMVRSLARGEDARREIVAKVPDARTEILAADLSSMQSVRDAAAELNKRHDKLHVLVHSAAVFHKERKETVDGFERTFATNYLSQFLFTNLVLDAMKRAAPARIVFVTSPYGNKRVDFDDLQIRNKKFSELNSVAPTKLAQILLAQELAERLKGTGVVANAVHPGLVKNTRLLLEVKGIWAFVTNTFGSSAEKGADTALWLATAPETANVTGKFWSKRKEMKTPGQGSDPAARKRLWQESEKLAKLA